jgi:hypothetical protein
MDVPMRFEGALTKFADWEVETTQVSQPQGLPFSKLTPSNVFDENPF